MVAGIGMHFFKEAAGCYYGWYRCTFFLKPAVAGIGVHNLQQVKAGYI